MRYFACDCKHDAMSEKIALLLKEESQLIKLFLCRKGRFFGMQDILNAASKVS